MTESPRNAPRHDEAINHDVSPALTSAKSVFAIVNGLTLTNTLLVLITGGHYSEVIPLGQLPPESVILAVVLMINVVRFYHGNVRHLDAAYGSESIARAASGRHVEPRGGLGLDFFIIFAQSLLFSLASFYINFPSTYISLFIVLLAFDVIWTVYSQRADGDLAASPQRSWLLNNLFAGVTLIVFYMGIFKADPERLWARDVSVFALAATTLVDFGLNWGFYFPANKKKVRPGENLVVFLSAPLTQYLADGGPSALMDSFREHWNGLAEALERSGHQVISAHRREIWGASIDSPDVALKDDLEGLRASDLVLAYIGSPPSPGVQLELGYAIAHHKSILVFIDEGQDTPYLVRGFPQMANLEVFDIKELGEIKQALYRKGLVETLGMP
jgi:nucleoside 2-deoxyribosyltransferase